MSQEVKLLKQTNTMEAMSKVFWPPSRWGARKLWRGSCRLSKYHSQKPESTRRTIFNQDSKLQLIVQTSSGNINSNVRARAKTHGRTPVSIELPRGRHLGSDACISLAQTPASFGLERPQLHCTRVHNKGLQTPTSPCARAQSIHACAKKIHAPQLARARRRVHLSCAHPNDARVGL